MPRPFTPLQAHENGLFLEALAQRRIDLIAVDTSGYGGRVVAGVDEALAAVGPLGGGDAVLVKGSRVAGLERLAALLLA